jgi:hypothetical protein
VCKRLIRRFLWIEFIDTSTQYFETTWNYSAVADLHTLQFTVTHELGFSVFTSRILETYLWPSYCNFKSHMKSSFHSLIPSLPFLLNHLGLPSPELAPILKNFLNELFFNRTLSTSELLPWKFPLHISSGRTLRKTPSSIVPYCFRRVYWYID